MPGPRQKHVGRGSRALLEQPFVFEANSYYKDMLVLLAFIAGFGLGVIFVVGQQRSRGDRRCPRRFRQDSPVSCDCRLRGLVH